MVRVAKHMSRENMRTLMNEHSARANPKYVGAPDRFIIWRPLKPKFFKFLGLGQGWINF